MKLCRECFCSGNQTLAKYVIGDMQLLTAEKPSADCPPVPGRVRLPSLSPEAYRHPLDRQATAALRAVPGFELLASKLSRHSLEHLLYVEACASAVKVTPRQCGRIHLLLREACAVLDMASEPALFLSQNPVANAFALGREMPTIVLHTGLVELLTEEELLGVIGHELGHIHCGHSVYRLMAWVVTTLASRFGATALGIGEFLSIGLQGALLEWARKAEFSADRAALLCTQNPETVFSSLFKLTGGSPRIFAEMDRDEYLKQADEYDNPAAGPLEKLYKNLIAGSQTHPIPVLRAREALRWGDSDDYRAILKGYYPRQDGTSVPLPTIAHTCPHCGKETDASFTFCMICGANLSAPPAEEFDHAQ